jgi:hypothetical protein
MLQGRVSDGGGELEVGFYGDIGEKIVGLAAEEVWGWGERGDRGRVKEALEGAKGKWWGMVVREKEGGRWGVGRVEEVDWKEVNEMMLQRIRIYMQKRKGELDDD